MADTEARSEKEIPWTPKNGRVTMKLGCFDARAAAWEWRATSPRETLRKPSMLSTAQIQELSGRIEREFDPERIVLFGSYAQGEASDDSDVDLLVVAETSLPPSQRFAAVRRLAADYPASFDIVVKTPEEYARARNVVNHIVYFADKYGRVLYER
jgi:predicted nucleotidyltransferase